MTTETLHSPPTLVKVMQRIDIFLGFIFLVLAVASLWNVYDSIFLGISSFLALWAGSTDNNYLFYILNILIGLFFAFS
jgi:hypothetical protein